MSAKVTLKSTKQEILDALRDAEKKLKEKQNILIAPTAAAEKSEEDAVVSAASSDVESGIFSDEMTSKYRNLTEAIKILETRLQTSYGIEAELIDMTTVINAKKQAQLSLDAELEQARADARAAIEQLKAENKQLQESLAVARKREQEEFNYNLKRQRQQESDAHSDKVALLSKKTAEAEAHLAELLSRAEEIEALQRRIDGLPDELDAKYQEGVESGKKEAGKEYGYKTAMADKEHSFEIRERDGRIERLEKDVADKAEKIASLETKLDAAYSQLRDLATKTVESSGGLKVISTSGDSNSARK